MQNIDILENYPKHMPLQCNFIFKPYVPSFHGIALQLMSETVAVRRGMIYDDHMITGDECDTNFLIFVLRLRENTGKTSTRKLTRPGIEPLPAT